MAKSTTKRQYKRKSTDGDPAERRATTIYFPLGLLKRAKKYCIDIDSELSFLVTNAVLEHLDKMNAPK